MNNLLNIGNIYYLLKVQNILCQLTENKLQGPEIKSNIYNNTVKSTITSYK